MRQLLFTLLTLISLSLCAKPAVVAYACSGGEPGASIDEIMQEATIVKATIVETDDAGINAILRVENYLRGDPAGEYLLFSRNDPVLTRVYYEYGYDTGCTYGGVSRHFAVGTRGYFALRRDADGAYRTLDSYAEPQLTLPVEQWRESILTDPAGDAYDPRNRTWLEGSTEESFLELLAQYGELVPMPPLEDQPYPLTVPLLITTDTGARYVFPVDRTPVLMGIAPETILEQNAHPSPNAYPALYDLPPYCAEIACTLSSPDRRLTAEQIDAQTITLTYPLREDAFTRVMPAPTVSGEAFAFSSTSEALISWNGGDLDVYLIQALVEEEMRLNQPQLRLLTSLTLDGGEIGAAEWSADGTMLIYADSVGLWSFDLFGDEQPTLIFARSFTANPVPLFVSTSGRYIGFQDGSGNPGWYTLDTAQSVIYENGLVSEDERRVALLGRAQPLEQMSIYDCPPPMMSNCPLVIDPMPQEFAWLDGSAYYVVGTLPAGTRGAYSARYDLAYVSHSDIGESQIRSTGDVIDVAYEPHQHVFVTVTDGHTLEFSDTNQEFDLSGEIDGAITHIEWLPPLFYYEG